MSVLIKGMKMPESCEQCVMSKTDSAGFFGCSITETIVLRKREKNRPSWCPLVDVPTPHGRLIDADELEDRLNAWTRDNFSFSDRYEYNLEGMIRASDIAMSLPTIIEAEEGEEA